MESRILALDFDGVICDSLPECFVSGFLAATGWDQNSTADELADKVRRESPEYREFCRWRPYVRSGEDYVLIALLQSGGIPAPGDQEQMDRHRTEAGMTRLGEYKKAIYRVREKFLAERETLWLDLNPLMPAISRFLPVLSSVPEVWILSTKKPEFISRILEHHGISWPRDRILEAAGEAKLAVMDRWWGKEAQVDFWDDQPDHFQGMPERIRCFLPSWGYIPPPGKSGTRNWIILDPESAAEAVAPWV